MWLFYYIMFRWEVNFTTVYRHSTEFRIRFNEIIGRGHLHLSLIFITQSQHWRWNRGMANRLQFLSLKYVPFFVSKAISFFDFHGMYFSSRFLEFYLFARFLSSIISCECHAICRAGFLRSVVNAEILVWK